MVIVSHLPSEFACCCCIAICCWDDGFFLADLDLSASNLQHVYKTKKLIDKQWCVYIEAIVYLYFIDVRLHTLVRIRLEYSTIYFKSSYKRRILNQRYLICPASSGFMAYNQSCTSLSPSVWSKYPRCLLTTLKYYKYILIINILII